jgi:hypothetical protein
MNSSSSSLPDIAQKTLWQCMAILEELHIASIEFTVMREKGHVKSLILEILYLPSEKKNQIT